MGQRCNILDRLYDQVGCHQGRDGRFATRSGSFDLHVHFFQAELQRLFGRHFSSPLSCERRTLAASLEADRSTRRGAEYIAIGVGNTDDCIVERCLNVGNATADVSSLLSFLALCHVAWPPDDLLAGNEPDCPFPAT